MGVTARAGSSPASGTDFYCLFDRRRFPVRFFAPWRTEHPPFGGISLSVLHQVPVGVRRQLERACQSLWVTVRGPLAALQ